MNRLYLEDVELGPDDGMEAVEDGGVVEAAPLGRCPWRGAG